MNWQIKRFINTKQFHICILIFIIFIILFVLAVTVLEYNTDGDNNLPFEISKISVISSVEGYDIENSENKWDLEVNQNNDIYLYVTKNEEYNKTETIKEIILNNFNIIQTSQVGSLKILKPDSNIESVIFKNTAENETNEIIYTGDVDSSIKEQKISNQGGLVVFRYAIEEIGNYISNDAEEVSHSDLLKEIGIDNDDLKFKVSFDITISLDSKKQYIATTELELPIGDVANQGTQSAENINVENIKFKRK